VAEEQTKGYFFYCQKAIYHLCAVVRVTKGKEERIRVYCKMGFELLPAEVGDYQKKELEAREPNWSITDPGEFMIYYCRL
jgi:hypothetical protein